MESIYTELALYGSKNECATTDIVSISEVRDGTVFLTNCLCEIHLLKQSNYLGLEPFHLLLQSQSITL